MKYSNYQTEDYLQDAQFMDWVLHPTPEKNAFWQEWLKSYPEHRERILTAREVILSMQFKSLEPTPDEYQEVLSGILRGRKSSDTPHHRSTRILSYTLGQPWLRVAAVLMVLVGLVFWLATLHPTDTPRAELPPVVKQTSSGQKSTLMLPDGSRVVLNADSRITYAEDFVGTERTVELVGEAFFEVARDTAKPFVVHAGDLYTKALGTAFNVRAYADDSLTEVSLTHGKVEVGRPEHQPTMTLVPGEKARYRLAGQTLQKDTLWYPADIAWKEGILHFNDAGFDEVRSRLERWYGVPFIVTDEQVEPWHYSGSFTEAPLERVLERLAYVQGFSFELQEKSVLITFTP